MAFYITLSYIAIRFRTVYINCWRHTSVTTFGGGGSNVVHSFGSWSLVVLMDRISVLGPVLGLDGVAGVVLAEDYTITVFVDTYMDLVINRC